MKYLKLLNIIPISFIVFATLALPAMAEWHKMNGNLDEGWGVKLQNAYDTDFSHSLNHDKDANYINSINSNPWKPTSSSVDYVIENNLDPNYIDNQVDSRLSAPFPHDWTWYDSTGTHIMKNGNMNSPTTFIETLIYPGQNGEGTPYYQPAGGEAYDIEALYFDDDNQNIYLAIVTSMPKGGVDNWKMGDIGLDINNDFSTNGKNSFEYGVKILYDSDYNKFKVGDIVSGPFWQDPTPSYEFPKNGPYKITGGVVVGSTSTFIYTDNPTENPETTTTTDGNTHISYNHVIEMTIPKKYVGNPGKDKLSNIHLTIGCGNDKIELTPVRFKNNIPEFPTIVLPVAAIMGIVLILGRRNKD